jgi:hypothetical protein
MWTGWVVACGVGLVLSRPATVRAAPAQAPAVASKVTETTPELTAGVVLVTGVTDNAAAAPEGVTGSGADVLGAAIAELAWNPRRAASTHALQYRLGANGYLDRESRTNVLQAFESANDFKLASTVDLRLFGMGQYGIVTDLEALTGLGADAASARPFAAQPTLRLMGEQGLTWRFGKLWTLREDGRAGWAKPLSGAAILQRNLAFDQRVRVTRSWKRAQAGVEVRGGWLHAFAREVTDPIAMLSLNLPASTSLIAQATAQGEWRLTPRLTSVVGAGAAAVLRPDFQVTETSPVVRAALTYLDDRGTDARLEAVREPRANQLFGATFFTDTVAARGGHEFGDGLQVRVYTDTGLQRERSSIEGGGVGAGVELDVFFAAAGASYRMTPTLALSLEYTFRRQTSNVDPLLMSLVFPSFTRNLVMLSVEARFPSSRTPMNLKERRLRRL